MPWLRSGDNAATHPIVMRVVSFAQSARARVLERDVAINEVFGFVTRCALQSAGHTTDYVIDEGTAFMLGGVRTERLVELAMRAGYLRRVRRRGVTAYLLVDDPEFLHMRTRAEIDRDRQRKADNANTTITVPVRLRDGDECRYCGVIVNWRDRKSNRGGTYDHRIPGEPATVDTLVVACQACNGGRGDDPSADERYPLRPPPSEPYYSAATASFLGNAGHRVTVTDENRRPGSQPDNAPASDPAASGTTRAATRQPAGPRTRRPNGPAPVTHAGPHNKANGPPGSAGIEHPESGFAGTGRDGPGSAGSAAPAPSRAARRKRSSRSRPTQQPTNQRKGSR